jgi:membrane protein YqaA with SNARE-associated domain
MSIEKKIETSVKQVLQTTTVGRAKQLLRDRSGLKVLSLISFIESALPLPILTDPFLIAAILVDKKNTIKLVLFTTTASLLGGLVAYFVATFFFDTIAVAITPQIAEELDRIITTNESSTFVLTIVGAVTPIPYTIIAWVVAITEGSLLAFILASIIGRGLRYSIVGYCTYKFGIQAVSYIKKYIGLTSVLVFILAGLFFWLKM